MRSLTVRTTKPVVGVRQGAIKIQQNHVLKTLVANTALHALTGNTLNRAA